MVPHCGFDLHSSDKEWCWASFHVFFSHLYVFLEKCLFSSLAHFMLGSFILLELSWRSCLYIFEINPLSVASFAIIFSQSEGCLIVSFVVQKLLSFTRSHLFIFAFISNILGIFENNTENFKTILRDLLKTYNWNNLSCKLDNSIFENKTFPNWLMDSVHSLLNF